MSTARPRRFAVIRVRSDPCTGLRWQAARAPLGRSSGFTRAVRGLSTTFVRLRLSGVPPHSLRPCAGLLTAFVRLRLLGLRRLHRSAGARGSRCPTRTTRRTRHATPVPPIRRERGTRATSVPSCRNTPGAPFLPSPCPPPRGTRNRPRPPPIRRATLGTQRMRVSRGSSPVEVSARPGIRTRLPPPKRAERPPGQRTPAGPDQRTPRRPRFRRARTPSAEERRTQRLRHKAWPTVVLAPAANGLACSTRRPPRFRAATRPRPSRDDRPARERQQLPRELGLPPESRVCLLPHPAQPAPLRQARPQKPTRNAALPLTRPRPLPRDRTLPPQADPLSPAQQVLPGAAQSAEP
ncbi:hypothetical protein APR11_001698 [Nocardia amikacinitolerans]|nr:hypothetical protein [Nocardia amikacinitolerans]